MRRFLLAGIAALSLSAIPATLYAQKQQPGGPESAAQANADARPAPATTTVTTSGAMPAQTTVTYNNPGSAGPQPESSMSKSYPRCTRQMQDNCQNSGEGGALGRSRALNHWPGKPASEGGR